MIEMVVFFMLFDGLTQLGPIQLSDDMFFFRMPSSSWE